MTSVHMAFPFDEYPIDIKHKGDNFYLICKKFLLVERAGTLDEAYKKLNESRRSFLAQMQELGITLANGSLYTSKDEYNTKENSILKNKILMLTLVIALLFAGFVMFVSYAKVVLNRNISNIVSGIELKVSNTIATKFGDISNASVLLDKLASTLERVTPERKEQIRHSLRRIVNTTQPFANELRPLFNDEK